MDFQIQVMYLGTDRERAQITFRGEDGMVHLPLEITEWSTRGFDGVRTVQGRIPELRNISGGREG